jgi:DKNYY family protein
VCLIAVAFLPGCTRDAPPSSLFSAGGYHVRGDKVYYLHAFPAEAFEIDGADPASFEAFDQTYARDKSTVYVDGAPLPDADAATFQLLDRPGFAKDAHHVYQRDRRVSDDPAHFELLDGELFADSTAVYWSDGDVLSDDPAHFAIISNADHYLFTKDTKTVHVNGNPINGADPATFHVVHGAYAQDDMRGFYFTDQIADADMASFHALEGPYAADNARVYWMGKPIMGADPSTFRVLNADFECSADADHAYYRNSVVAGANPSTFPVGRAVTRCDETSISFAD